MRFNSLLFILMMSLSHAFNPPCSTCKYFMPSSIKNDLSLCSKFQDNFYINNQVKMINHLAINCRNIEHLCGKTGLFHETMDQDLTKKYSNYEYLKSLSCGEFIEKNDLNELDKIEKELLEIFQKMRKHNTKRIYRTTKELYDLIKNKNKD